MITAFYFISTVIQQAAGNQIVNGEEDYKSKAGKSLGGSMTVGRQFSLPIKIINEVRHLL